MGLDAHGVYWIECHSASFLSLYGEQFAFTIEGMDGDLDDIRLDMLFAVAVNLDSVLYLFFRDPLDEKRIPFVLVPHNPVHEPTGQDLGEMAVSKRHDGSDLLAHPQGSGHGPELVKKSVPLDFLIQFLRIDLLTSKHKIRSGWGQGDFIDPGRVKREIGELAIP